MNKQKEKQLKTERAMVLFSGGVDSTTCLALALEKYGQENVIPLSISYGQKHQKELAAAKALLEYYDLTGLETDLTEIFADSNCSLLAHSKEELPEESYATQLQQGDGSPVSTYVPFRNGLFLSVAASMALAHECSCIYYGAHHDDAAGNAYPDCSEVFYTAMNTAIYEGSGRQLRVEAPFINCSKAAIVKEGLRLGVPYQLTWSCYAGKEQPCGVCGTCIDREQAFRANGIEGL